jgi:hypothetical protein
VRAEDVSQGQIFDGGPKFDDALHGALIDAVNRFGNFINY